MKRTTSVFLGIILVFVFISTPMTTVFGEESYEVIDLNDPNLIYGSKIGPDFYDDLENAGDKVQLELQLVTEEWKKEIKDNLKNTEGFDSNGNLKVYDNDDLNDKILQKYQDRVYKVNLKAIHSFHKIADFDYEVLHESKYSPFIRIEMNVVDVHSVVLSDLVLYVKVINQERVDDFDCASEAAGCIDIICSDMGGDGGGDSEDDGESSEDNEPVIDSTDILTPFNTIEVAYAHDRGYTGDGIKIGVIEAFDVEPVEGLLESDRIRYQYDREFDPTDFNTHATLVALVAAGSQGVAPDAEIYSARRTEGIFPDSTTDGDLFDEVEWLLSNNVHVINISAALGGPCEYSYDNEYTQYFDYISRAYFVSIITSSGNNMCDESQVPEYSITRPGLGSNVITVGATKNDGSDLADYSSFVIGSGIAIDKPNLVAPGGPYSFGEYPVTDRNEGTSFAAPMVAGALAILFDKDYSLRYKPHVVSAILMASAEYVDFGGIETQSGLYEKTGAGLLNIRRLVECDYYNEWVFNENDNTLNKYFSINIDYTEKVRIAGVWLRNQHQVDILNVEDSQFKYKIQSANNSTEKEVVYGNNILFEFVNYSLDPNCDIWITPTDLNYGNYIYNETIYDNTNSIYGAVAIYRYESWEE